MVCGRNWGLKNAVQKIAQVRIGCCPTAGIEHESRDSGDQDQADPGGGCINPADDDVGFFGHPPPIVIEEERSDDFNDEKDPFGSPAEDERTDKGFGGQRRSQPDRPPNAHAADGSENNRQQNENSGVAVEILRVIAIVGAVGVLDFGSQKQSAADCVVRHENV